MGIVSKADVEKREVEAAFSNPLSSGPYMVKDWKPNDRLILEPNPHYWRAGYPKSDAEIAVIEVVSTQTRIAMLKSGEADVVRDIPFAQIEDVKATAHVDMRLEPSTMIFMTLLNHQREPFSNLKARQAATHAIDVRAMTQAVTLGNADPANTTLPKSVEFHDPDYPGISYNPALAKQLLAESGMEGREVKILAIPDASAQQTALLLQAQWQAIGLKPVIVSLDTAAWWETTGKGDYDAARTLSTHSTKTPRWMR